MILVVPEDLQKFTEAVREVADYLEQRSNNYAHGYRFAPELRDQGAKLRIALIELEKTCGKI